MQKISNMSNFCEDVFQEGQEMVTLVKELNISYYGAHFMRVYDYKEYFDHNKELLLYERQKEILRELDYTDLD